MSRTAAWRRADVVGEPSRLGWLDALRGFAVLLVLYEHITWHVLGVLRDHTTAWFDAGRAGVFLFFLISGYIVPASLERHGSPRRFWVSRIFRLYPLVVVGTVATLILGATGAVPLDPVAIKKTWATAIASATMLQAPLGLPSVPAILWTLSYEMIFYLLVSAIFVLGLHKRSAEWAVMFAAVALVLGGVLPLAVLSVGGSSTLNAAVLVLVGFVPGLALLMSGRPTLVVVGGVTTGIVALAVLTIAVQFPAWYTMAIPAAMFSGTAVYRADHGEVGWKRTGVAVGLVYVCTISAMWWSLPDASLRTLKTTGQWVGSLSLAAAIFALGMAMRRRYSARLLAGLGLISYSVYVLHFILVAWLDRFMDPYHDAAIVIQILVAICFGALVVGASTLSYRFVELPTRAAGRRIQRFLDRHLGPERARRRVYTPKRQLPRSPKQVEAEAQSTV